MSKRTHTIITIVAVFVAAVALVTRVQINTHSANVSTGAGAEPPTPKGWTRKGGPVERVIVHTKTHGGQIVMARLPNGTPVSAVSCPDGITYLAGTESVNGTSTSASVTAIGGGPTTRSCTVPGKGSTR